MKVRKKDTQRTTPSAISSVVEDDRSARGGLGVDKPHAQVASQEQIAKRAYELYEQRGCQDGHSLDDWLQAEREISRLSRA